MDKKTLKCPKCGGEMEEGILSDFTYTSVTRVRWAKRLDLLLGLFNSVVDPRKLTSFRCINCGFLESYAN